MTCVVAMTRSRAFDSLLARFTTRPLASHSRPLSILANTPGSSSSKPAYGHVYLYSYPRQSGRTLSRLLQARLKAFDGRIRRVRLGGEIGLPVGTPSRESEAEAEMGPEVKHHDDCQPETVVTFQTRLYLYAWIHIARGFVGFGLF